MKAQMQAARLPASRFTSEWRHFNEFVELLSLPAFRSSRPTFRYAGPQMTIALSFEFPITQYDGTEIFVSGLIPGFWERYEVSLVSPDSQQTRGESEAGSLIDSRISFKPIGLQLSTREKCLPI